MVLWIKTVMNMLRNPETGDIEGVIYSMDVTQEHENKDVLRIPRGVNMIYSDTASGYQHC